MKIQIMKYTLSILIVWGFQTIYAQLGNSQSRDKTKEQVDAQIKQAGETIPDWWDSVELKYPETLDMNWPVQQGIWEGRGGRGERGQPGGGERGRRGARGAAPGQTPTNVDQYLMQIIYPNPSLHKQGIKLVSQLMSLHKDTGEKYNRDMNTLGYLFHDLTADYARAAYWWQKYADSGGSADALKIARCYCELGSKIAAVEILSKAGSPNRDIIKLWATIGEVDKALEMIDSNTATVAGNRGSGRGNNPLSQNYMLAAEICRQAGKYDQTVAYYQKVADAQTDNQANPSRQGRGEDGRSLRVRANANIEAIKLIQTLDLKRVPDGTYTGTGTGHEGTLTIQVTIKNGKIESVEVTQQRETPNRYAMVEQLTRKIVAKQGIEGVDAVTGATETSDAIINAVTKAMVSAMK